MTYSDFVDHHTLSNLVHKLQGLEMEPWKKIRRILQAASCKMRGLALVYFAIYAMGNAFSPRLRADTFDDAEKSARAVISHYEDFRKLDLDSTMKLLLAISEADVDTRKRVAEDASKEAMQRVNNDFEKIEKQKDEALRLLDEVLNKPELKEKFSPAQGLRREVLDKFAKISSMRTNLEPVAFYLAKAGTDMEESRHGGCRVYKFKTRSGEADCIRTNCELIEYKPDDSRNVNKGKEQVKAVAKDLESVDVRNTLIAIDKDFAKCEKFKLTVEAYKLSPYINDDGSVRTSSASWSTYTVN